MGADHHRRQLIAALALALCAAPAQAIWIANVETSPMDGKQSLVLGVDSVSRDRRERERTLTIQCDGGKLELVFRVGEVLEQFMPDRVEIRVRYDAGPARKVHGNRSTSYQAVFLDDPRNHVRALLKAKRALIEFRPFTKGPVIAEFDVAGLRDYSDLLKKHCRI